MLKNVFINKFYLQNNHLANHFHNIILSQCNAVIGFLLYVLTEGLGFRLAACKKIVEQRGGKIWVQSQVGIGTDFYIEIIK